MRRILSAKDHRLIQIIELLMDHDWISLRTLSSKINCSEKTIRNDLNTLTTLYPNVNIETSNLLGYRLNRPQSYTAENTINNIISDSLIAQLNFLLLKNSSLRLIDLEEHFFVSANSIRHAVTQFNQFFEPQNDFEIKSKPYELVGDETKITTLYLVSLLESYFHKEATYQKEFKLIDQLITLIFNENHLLKQRFSHNRHVLNLLFYVRIYRESNHHSASNNLTDAQVNYSFIHNKPFRDDFYSIFHVSLTNELLNAIINFALFQPATVSYLRMSYFFSKAASQYSLHTIIHSLLNQLATKLILPKLHSNDVTKMLQPRELFFSNIALDYQTHDFLLQIITYELDSFLDNDQTFRVNSLYKLYVIPELATLIAIEWPELTSRIKTIDLTMIVGIDLLADSIQQSLYIEFFNFHCDKRIIFKNITADSSVESIDLLITNLTVPRYDNCPMINVGYSPKMDYLKHIERLYTEFKLKRYLTYAHKTLNLYHPTALLTTTS